MPSTVPKRFRRQPLHHGHWCDPRDGVCHADPCQIALRWTLTDTGLLTIAVTQQPDRAVVRLLCDAGVAATFPPGDIANFIECLEDAHTVASGEWPQYIVS